MGYFSRERRLYRSLVGAIRKKDIAKMTRLLDEGAPLVKPEREEYGASPLHHAAEAEFREGVDLLLARGADLENKQGWNGRTPFLAVAYSQQADIAQYLLDKGADINAQTDGWRGRGALHEAHEYSHKKIFDLLVANGANLNLRNVDGQTILHLAAKSGNSDDITRFLALGADPMVRDKHMNTAADVAQKEYPGIADLLRGVMPKEPEKKNDAALAEGWQLTAADEVARVTLKNGLGYRLTEIFNFSTHLYTHLAQNTATGAESHSIRHFDDLGNSSVVESARAALQSLGGRAPEAPRLQKPALTTPGAA